MDVGAVEVLLRLEKALRPLMPLLVLFPLFPLFMLAASEVAASPRESRDWPASAGT